MRGYTGWCDGPTEPPALAIYEMWVLKLGGPIVPHRLSK